MLFLLRGRWLETILEQGQGQARRGLVPPSPQAVLEVWDQATDLCGITSTEKDDPGATLAWKRDLFEHPALESPVIVK